MPTPSSDAPDPGSPPRYPFSSCPDPEDPEQGSLPQPTTSTTTTTTTTTIPSQLVNPSHLFPLSPPTGWQQRHQYPPPPAYSIDAPGSHATTNMHDDSRSTTMSPGPLTEMAVAREDVDMDQERDQTHDQEPEGMVLLADDRHEPADGDEEMSPVGASSSSTSRDVARTALGRTPGRRKARAAEPLSPVAAGETYEFEMGGGPAGAAAGGGAGGGRGPRWVEDSGLVGLGLEYSHMRVIPSSTSVYLQPGTKFAGTQQSERQRYDVEVEIKYVDMRESFLCGYLRIQGLTKDHPTLTTYFEGEIIGTKYGFVTQHQGWGATEKIDLSHWSKFTAFRPYLKQARKGGHPVIKDVDQRENIFMRWKEHFLVPDHRVRTINGASFEGFYYICFNQVRGEVSGIYFHSKSEKFQQLELKHVPDRGCFASMEFR